MAEDRREPTKWQIAIRVIVALLVIIQIGFVGWARWITNEVLDSKPERSTIISDINHIKEDVSYLRGQFDREDDRRRDKR